MSKGSLLATPYPTAAEWKTLLKQFSAEAIAHKLLLSHIPFVFREEPAKFALFRKTIGDAFGIDPSCVFIVGSAMAGRSLKGKDIDKPYSSASDIDTLIVSEHLFAYYVMRSLEWLKDITKGDYDEEAGHPVTEAIPAERAKHVHWLSLHACRGIWRPDSLPNDATVRNEFFDKFNDVSLKVLGLQLSEDTVSHVTGRVARSFDDAVSDLAQNILRLGKELDPPQKNSTPKVAH